MTDEGRDETAGWRLMLDRLRQARWTLGASAAAIALVAWAGGASPLVAGGGIAAVAAAAALIPRRPRLERESGRRNAAILSGVERLPAVRLADAVPDPLVIFDRAGVVVYANGAAHRTFSGLQPGIDLQLRFRSPEMQTLVRNALDGEASSEPVDYPERVPIERLFRVSATAIGDGSDLHVLVFKDQSETRRIDRMRADFIANASHELRTPLATISGFIETLRGPAREDVAARERFLGIMHSQTLRMARLIDDLLSLSRIEMKPFVAQGEKVDLKLVIGSVIDSLNQLAAENGVVVERRFTDARIEVPGSRDELFQVFENLIENACKYGQAGGRVEITIDAVTTGARPEAEVTVRDFGPGIAEEHIPRITERFYRVDVENSRAQKGTGLGLSIVKHILTRHNARLSIRSTLGEGAAFTVNLPLG